MTTGPRVVGPHEPAWTEAAPAEGGEDRALDLVLDGLRARIAARRRP